ncbi:MAG: thiolase C-terminal domain-containing protein [Anaerolineales bacterium]
MAGTQGIRSVSVVGIGQIPVRKAWPDSLRQLGTRALGLAMEEAGVDRVDALMVGNMLADELQGQKHLATLLADEAGLAGIEAVEARAATASGAAALRLAYLAVASGEADLAAALGVEKMSEGVATPALAKALDAEVEVARGASLIGRNAELLRLYLERYRLPPDALIRFPVNAHRNARDNPNALFRGRVGRREVRNSRVVYPPLRLLDCAPICDGAAAVILAPTEQARAYTERPVRLLASSVATDRMRIEDRADPLRLEAVQASTQAALRLANVHRGDIRVFELHDAFSIMACLSLEAAGYAETGRGWRLAEEGRIGLRGEIPISTFGGLKARGHPIGATSLYQVCEIVLQLTGRAGRNQVRNVSVGMQQSVGGVASTAVTHIFAAP